MSTKQAKLTIRIDRKLGIISPYIYGIRCSECFDVGTNLIWVGEKSSIPNIHGIRKDTVETLQRLSPSFMSVIGGPFYHWEDGIGPREKRPVKVLYWGRSPFEKVKMEWRFDFGTDEFIRFCRLVDSEPLIITNEETPEGSRNWLEYCNYEGDSYYTRLRIANGHKKPYNVKFWNVYGWLDMEPEEYALSYRRFVSVARMIDPKVMLIAAGGSKEWNIRFFEKLNKAMNRNFGGVDLVDYLGQITYTGQNLPDTDYTDVDYYRVLHNSTGLKENISRVDEIIHTYSRDRKPWGIDWLQMPSVGTPAIQIAYLEWGTSHYIEKQTMRDAIAEAIMLDIFHHWAGRVTMASHWLHTLIQGDDDRIWLTPAYHLLNMYSAHKGNESVRVEIECDEIIGEDLAKEEDFMGAGGLASGISLSKLPPLSMLSSSASRTTDLKDMVISITNCHLIEAVEVGVNIPGIGKPLGGQLKVLTAKNVRDYNDTEHPDRVCPKVIDFSPNGNYFTLTLEPHSVNTLILKLKTGG